MKLVLFAVLIFFVSVAQGAYFVFPQIILALFFLGSIVLSKKEQSFDLNMALLVGLFFVMLASSFFSLSSGAAITELVKYLLFPLSYAFFAGLGPDEKKKTEETFYRAFILVMVFGLLGMAGISPIGGMVTEIGGRLQSFFGYANTTALVMGIGAFYATEKFLASKKKYHVIIGALFFAAMVFTLSRTSFVLFVGIYLLYVFRFLQTKTKLMFAASGTAVFVALALFDSRLLQISIFAPTLVERYISYFDALPMMFRTPFGAGLGNWQFLQFSYQSAPYQVRYIHNFYLQVGLDGGLVALSIVLFFVTGFLRMFGKLRGGQNVHYYIAAFLLSSSFFEVHFNFGLVIVYSMLLLACISESKAFDIKLPAWQVKGVAAVLALPLVVLLVSEHFANSGSSYENAGNRQAAFSSYSTARQFNPLNDGLLLNLARVAPSGGVAIEYLNMAYEANKYNAEVIFSLAQGLAHFGDLQGAYAHAMRLVEIFPFSGRNHDLVRSIIYEFDVAYQEQKLHDLNRRIDEINSRINPLFRHIDPYLAY